MRKGARREPGASIMARVFTRFMRKNARAQQQRFKRVMEAGGAED